MKIEQDGTPVGLLDKNGQPVFVGDVFTFPVWDNDDYVTWEMRYYAAGSDAFVYLGGGCDFGSLLGKVYSKSDVEADIELEDTDDRGVTIVSRIGKP